MVSKATKIQKIFSRIMFAIILIAASVYCAAYEKVLSAGLQNHSVSQDTGFSDIDNGDNSDSSYYVGFRLRNNVGKLKNHWVGVGLDYDEILGQRVIGYRAVDYQRALGKRARVGTFIGAASLDSGLPQNGYYLGVNTSYAVIPNRLALSVELRHGNGLARDRKRDEPRPTEEAKPDIFLDFTSTAFGINWYF